METERPITIRDLYPQMSESELAVAEANLKRYVAIILRIYDRCKAEGRSWPDAGNLTVCGKHPTIAAQRSNSPQSHN